MTGRHCAGLAEVLAKPAAAEYSVLAMITRDTAGLDSTFWRGAFLAGVALAVLVIALLAARWRPLWYDELFTLYVASETSVGATVSALLAGADTNPPLDYVLRHLSLAFFGESPAAFRWPSALAFIAGLLAIFAYVRRRTGFAPAAAAFVLPISSAAVFFAHEGRAYALLFASAPIALWAWQRAIDRRQPLRLLTLLFALCLGPFSHYFGVLNFIPVAAGEAWRSWQRRRVDWGIVATGAGACVLLLGLQPFARGAVSMKQAFWASEFRVADLPGYYTGYLQWAGWAFVIVLVAVTLLAVSGGRFSRATRLAPIPSHEIVAAVILALTPFSAFLLAQLFTGALTSKYTITLVPGVAILLGYLLATAESSSRVLVGLALGVLTAIGLGRFAASALEYRAIEPAPLQLARMLPPGFSLPVAFDSPHLFLETVHYQPQFAFGRFYYPMDAETALATRGFNNDELALRRLGQIVPLNVAEYREFLQRNPEFLLVYSSDFWPGLIKALQRDGICLRTVAQSGTTTILFAFPGCVGVAQPHQPN